MSTSDLPDSDSAVAAPQPARPDQRWPAGRLVPLFLVGILLLAAVFRFTSINWDDYTHLHPDERFLTLVTDRLERPDSFLAYLRTSESPLNPYNKGEGFYVYGNFPMTATFFAGEAAEWARVTFCPTDSTSIWCTNNLGSYNGVHFVGRVLSGLLDLVSVLFTYLIGRRLYGRAAGLVAAFLMATAVMPIQQSHFYTMDNWAAAFSTIALYAAVRASEDGARYRWWIAFGLFLGLTVSSRINVAPLALMAGVAGVVWLVRRYQAAENGAQGTGNGSFWRYLGSERGLYRLQFVVMAGMAAAFVSLLIFRVGMPYAFADAQIARQSYLEEYGQEPSFLRVAAQSLVGLNPQWLANMEEIQRLQSPEASFPPALQWVDRAPILFPLINMLLYGMGPLAGLLAWVGFCVALWRIVRGRPDWLLHALPVGWVGLYFFFIALRWVKSIRYFLPIYPALFVLAGWLIAAVILRQVGNRAAVTAGWRAWLTPRRALGGVVALLTLGSSFLWANAFVEIYRQPLTRVAASEWIYDNVPTAATVTYEAFGETRQLQLPLTGLELAPGVPGIPLSFSLPVDGVITGVRLAKVSDSDGQPAGSETIRAALNGRFDEDAAVQAETVVDLDASPSPVDLPLEPTLALADQEQLLVLSAGPGGNFRLDTSILTSEHWDDPLPVRSGGRDPFSQYYFGLAEGPMPTTFPDNSPEKRQNLLSWLDQADYVVISSQRSLWSLPRLPLMYPLMMRYYEALFSGELGFELAAEFHGDIHLGPLYVSDTGGKIGWGAPPEIGWPPPGDLAAEEAFSVYDHPPVWIFRKTESYSPARAAAVLNAVDLSNAVVMNPLEATNAVDGLLLTAEEQAVQQAGGTFAELFSPEGILSNNDFLAAVTWWLLVIVLGWLAFPLAFTVFSGLSDRGFALARILALLVISWFAWLMGSFQWLPHTAGTLWLGALLLALVSGWLGWRNRTELGRFIREQWRYLLLLEGIGLLLFLAQLGIRLGNPDAWHVIWGGEKPMDMAYFTAVLKSTIFPPYDPWFAGGAINYYYFGFVYVGSLTKMLGIVPAVAYNLILPMLFSFTGLAVFSLAYSLAERFGDGANFGRVDGQLIRRRTSLWAGGAAGIAAVFLGNLRQIGVLFAAWQGASTLSLDSNPLLRILQGGWRIVSGQTAAPIYPGDWFWSATRGITVPQGEVGPITEFPFFTFLYGDLHAHMIALPLALLALGWALGLAFRRGGWRQPGPAEAAAFWFVPALAIGVLYPTNSWDYPTYLVLALLAIFYANWRQDDWSLKLVGTTLVQAAALTALSLLLFWPFWANFGTGYGAVRLWEGSKTSIGDYLSIHGLFLFLLVPWLFIDLKLWLQTRSLAWLQERAGVTAAGVGGGFIVAPVLILGLLQGIEVFPITLLLILFAGLLSLRRDLSPGRRAVNVLTASALALTLVVELVVLDGDIGRMNTVFKFYMQVWLLLSIAGGAALVWFWRHIRQRWGPFGRSFWTAGLAALVLIATLYPILATRAKWAIRENRETAPLTLDGMRYMADVSYGDQGEIIHLGDDYDAIRWMQRNLPGSPVIVEAFSGNPYRSTANRVSMYTGLPGVIGWDWHQRQQRNTVPSSLVSQRIQDVNTLYSTTDFGLARQILDKYDVRYVYAGQMEIVYYGLAGVLKFDRMVERGILREVYRNAGVSIYEVLDENS